MNKRDEFLKTQKILRLCTIDKNNFPHITPVWYTQAEKKLVNPTLELDYDIFVCGDDNESVQVVNGLIDEIKGLRSIYLGPIELSYLAEMSTPLLLNAMIRNKIKNPGIKIIQYIYHES